MTVSELLTKLQSLDIKIWADEDKLRVNAPQGVLTEELRDDLIAHKAKLVRFLQSTASLSGPSRQPRSNEQAFPLSFSQQRLWFLDRFEPGNIAYNVLEQLHVKGRLDVAALERALNEILNRHEALRTVFPLYEGQPVQKILPYNPRLLPVVDLQALPESEQKAEAERLIAEEEQHPFELAHGPLFRASLLRLGEEEHLLLVNMHHIVSDGWSLSIFTNELELLYRAYIEGNRSPLPELPLQYVDFSVWQRELLQGPVLENQLAYWRMQLGGKLPVLDMPTDHPRPAKQTYRGALKDAIVPPSLRDEIKELAQLEGSTLFMILLAAFKVLLARYSGQEDILVGTPIANRSRVEFEQLIGFFINTLVLRADLSGNPTFRELLARVRSVALEAYDHQDVPFEFLVEILQPERDPSRSPMFQTMFILQNAPYEPIELPGLTIYPLEDQGHTAKFDLTLTIWEQEPDFGPYPEGLMVSFEYNTDLFEPATIDRLMNHFQTLLEAIVADPDRPIAELPLLSEAERQQLLVDWNATETGYPHKQSIHGLVEAQTARTPEAVAIVCGDERITFKALNRRANELAHHLQALGVGREDFAGIYMERSVDMVVALLAVLKVGGAYVPLDPSFPRERLAYMMEDCQASVLLTHQNLLVQAPDHRAQVVCLDSDAETIAGYDEQNPENDILADNLAYVIYTSGSTGRPKGVQIEHRSLVNFLASMQREPGLSAEDVLLSVTTLSFDIAGLELFLPLTVGATVVIASSAEAADGERLLERMARSGATVMQATPATWRLLLASGWSKETPIKVLCGGEAMSRELADALLARSRSVWNLYGPTETTVWSAVHRVRPGSGPVPVGRPMANTQLYILDDDMQPVPVGVTGELYIGGAGLARGYLNRPELNAEKFISNPFSDQPDQRLYRTGDLAHYRSDGAIDFLGRIDHQVKVRGFRIELGEIESVLNRQPHVRQAVVVAREDQPGDKRLVAYLITEPERSVPASALRTDLKETLPDYMIPSHFVFLESLPLTPNKKVDRRALPAPDLSGVSRERAYVAPRTLVEEVLAEMWARILKLERVGIKDNFFELGGHSLLATQVVSRVRQALGVEVALRRLFEAPTVAGLAEQVEQMLRAGRMKEAPAIEPVAREGKLPLSFSQERIWFIERLQPGSAAYNVTVAVRGQGDLDEEVLQRCFRELVGRHESLRTTIGTVDGQPVQQVATALEIELPTIDLNDLQEEARESRLQEQLNEQASKPFDLERGPLLRPVLFWLGEEAYVLLVIMHHVISDAWSVDLFWKELAALYHAFIAGDESPLAELPIQFADYAAWQRDYFQGEVLEEQVAYWRERLEGVPALNLPADYPRPAVPSYRGAAQSVMLEETLFQRMRKLSQEENATPFIAMLSAFVTLLRRYTGQEDIAIGVPIANRHWLASESLIGTLINMLVLRNKLSGEMTFRELVRQTRQVAMEAYIHQDLPFEKLVDELQVERTTSHAPLFQTMFNYINVSEIEAPPGQRWEELAVDRGAAQFDVTMTVVDDGQELEIELEYSTDLFSAETMRRMLGHYVTVLEAAVENADLPLSELSVLTPDERKQILARWNETETAYEQTLCLHQLFERQAEARPEAVAVTFGKQQLSYGELNRRANQLSQHLRGLGVEPETAVGICVERSAEMVVGLLGILKAGGAYVPLDPAFPQQRLASMLKDSKANVLLTEEKLRGLLPSEGIYQVCLDGDAASLKAEGAQQRTEQQRAERPNVDVGGENRAYIIYTSGSTGKPKGVQIAHRSAVNFLLSMSREPGMTAEDVLLAVTTLSFDISLLELFLPLLVGGQVVVASREVASDGRLLQETLAESGATVMQATPATWRMLIDAGWQGNERLRVLCGGEALPRDLAEQLIARSDELWNMYGPTETTVWSTVEKVEAAALTGEAAALKAEGTISIGRPIANTEVYVLDGQLQPVPVGVPGTLYIGGDGLALGYLNRPALTSEKFITHPFSEEDGARIYNTGDVARYLPDGRLEHLGRSDHQVKVRGFRIELGEIEAVLAGHAAVRDVVVMAREDEVAALTDEAAALTKDKRLVAYLIPDESLPVPSSGELRDFVRKTLPDYMTPSAYVFLEIFPQTPNRKVDRKALPAPTFSRDNSNHQFVAPRSDTEQTIAAIMSDVLNLPEVGILDNFFDLGGHSLLGAQLISRIQKELNVKVPLRVLFEAPTVAELTVVVMVKRDTSAGQDTELDDKLRMLESF